MKELLSRRLRWRLADLLDFELLLARDPEPVDERDRTLFARDVRSKLAALPEPGRRRAGLRLWLDMRRDHESSWPGAAWAHGVTALRVILFAAMAFSGGALVIGLCLGTGQRVHVVVFLALVLLLPWLMFLAVLAVRLFVGQSLPIAGRLVGAVLRTTGSGSLPAAALRRRWLNALVDCRFARRAFAARISGLMQWGGLGFSLGVAVTFVATLMIFDVRFYWEATPGNDGLMRGAVATLAVPWSRLWPGAAPTATQVTVSRLRPNASSALAPGRDIAAAWWRFLLMAVLVWGALPRLLLIGLFALRRRRALARLDFQAPRHRALWRALAGVERGATAAAGGDDALLLDVGGTGIDGQAIRGFMLRRLRLNPSVGYRVSVLDDAAEAAADAALGNKPRHVVLVAADWALSPRQAAALQARVREYVGAKTPLTWVIAAFDDGMPAAPDADYLARWTAFVDGLRDPATEIAGYDPAA